MIDLWISCFKFLPHQNFSPSAEFLQGLVGKDQNNKTSQPGLGGVFFGGHMKTNDKMVGFLFTQEVVIFQVVRFTMVLVLFEVPSQIFCLSLHVIHP